MRSDTLSLVEALGLPGTGTLISIVGGGGKSALLFALGRRLPGVVVLSTTTRIFAAQRARAAASVSLEAAAFESAWSTHGSGLLVVGAVEGEKAHGVPPETPAEWLRRPDVDHVVVEADGSRMRPAKAPAEHEPVLASGSTHVVVVAGLDALAGPIDETCHRPEKVCSLLGCGPGDVLDAAGLARLMSSPQGGAKNVDANARLILMLNKVEDAAGFALARDLAAHALESARVDAVVAGALEGPAPDRWLRYARG